MELERTVMNRNKILSNFSSKFKKKKVRDEFNRNDKKLKKEKLRIVRRAKLEEDDMCFIDRDRDRDNN
jgi:hypothetical protein